MSKLHCRFLSNESLLEYAKVFHVHGHGYNTEHTPTAHYRILENTLSNSIGLLLETSSKEPILLLTLYDGLYEDVHIHGKGVYTDYLYSNCTSIRAIRMMHRELVKLCKSLGASWYTLSWRVAPDTYQMKYYRIKETL